jgi:hypothetical protein
VTIQACSDLVVLGADGTYLGQAQSSPLAPEGVCNSLGTYGSPLSATSIFNKLGTYGGELSSQGAYNVLALKSPVLYCLTSSSAVASITKNILLQNPIDPDILCNLLAQNLL